ncbi:MAG: aquaporin [Proteobacteria bacterium]|nr:aquaporin [Pseudomonadota bacterium]
MRRQPQPAPESANEPNVSPCPGFGLGRKAFAELLGTAALLCAVVGSGIMAQRLAGGDGASALLANSLATMFALYVLIEALGPVSGAHLNPVVSSVLLLRRELPLRDFAVYVPAQLVGAVLGAWLANAMFDLSVFQLSTSVHTGMGQWLSEFVATAGLVVVILRAPPGKLAVLAACYIGAGIWFTASSSFANPAGVLGRMLTDTYTGIAPSSAIPFVLAQLSGMAAGLSVNRVFR